MIVKQQLNHAEVNIYETVNVRHMYFGAKIAEGKPKYIQGSMFIEAPTLLALDYSKRMMFWLLFFDPSTVASRHVMQLGLGAGSLTKFCYKRLRMRTTAIEYNPQVIQACRKWFKLPPNNARLRVILADAAQEVRKPEWLGAVDVLQVDAYDGDSEAPKLDSIDFYTHCRAMLAEEGCMVVNLFGGKSNFNATLGKLKQVFANEQVYSFPADGAGNVVLLAQRTRLKAKPEELEARAIYVQEHWGLPADAWL